jgi:hypothetical protein
VPNAVREVLDEARAAVAAGRELDADELARRIRDAGGGERALKQLERVLAVHRARARVTQRPSGPARQSQLRTRPAISANMDVRRRTKSEPFVLEWDAIRGVESWEVRFSERPDPRRDYEVVETLTLAGDATSVELPLAERPLRVHLLGRRRDGRLVGRAVISGLTAANWNDRWQRRASAA